MINLEAFVKTKKQVLGLNLHLKFWKFAKDLEDWTGLKFEGKLLE